jgi:signal transduction histidine kinase
MADTLQRSEERRVELLADVAHEFRTPPSNLRGYVEGLQDGVFEDDATVFDASRRQLDLPNVFKRFYRGDKARCPHAGGSGIGLTIARQLVELQGGEIGVASPPGLGATFHFTLPEA